MTATLPIGVELAAAFADPGGLFADLRALDAAGADSVWHAGDEDPWTWCAAAAAVTWRLRLVLPASATAAADWQPRLQGLQRLARQRVVLATDDADEAGRLRAGAAPTAIWVVAPAPAPTAPIDRDGAPRWQRVDFPADRAAWRAARAAATATGAAGILVRHDARLLDLLRNPDREDDRSDLQLAQG